MHKHQIVNSAEEGSEDWHNERRYVEHVGYSEGLQNVWSFCDNVKFVGVQTETGTVLNVSRRIFDWLDPSNPSSSNINLFVGVVGSGVGFDEDFQQEYGLDEHSLRSRFGPFLHLPVVFRRPEFDEYFQRLQSWEGAPSKKQVPHEEVAAQIVNEFDNGVSITKRWVKENLAQGMKVEEFLATWKMAVEQRPDLSKPGPRKK